MQKERGRGKVERWRGVGPAADEAACARRRGKNVEEGGMETKKQKCKKWMTERQERRRVPPSPSVYEYTQVECMQK